MAETRTPPPPITPEAMIIYSLLTPAVSAFGTDVIASLGDEDVVLGPAKKLSLTQKG